jgi:hypothetical protein
LSGCGVGACDTRRGEKAKGRALTVQGQSALVLDAVSVKNFADHSIYFE